LLQSCFDGYWTLGYYDQIRLTPKSPYQTIRRSEPFAT